MKSGGGKAKGNAWELEICKHLSRWISRGEKSDLFVRNVTSGGAFTFALRSGREQGTPGDLMSGGEPEATTFLKLWMVEAKHWRDLGLHIAMWRSSGDLLKEIDKAEKQAVGTGRSMLFVAKQNRQPAICFVNYEAGIERTREADLIYHVLWRHRVVAFRFDHLLLTQPRIWT